MAGASRLQWLPHLSELWSYLESNQSALVYYAARRDVVSRFDHFVESAVNEIVAKRVSKTPADALEQDDSATIPRRPNRTEPPR
jgi:hypothetical protein